MLRIAREYPSGSRKLIWHWPLTETDAFLERLITDPIIPCRHRAPALVLIVRSHQIRLGNVSDAAPAASRDEHAIVAFSILPLRFK